METEPLTAADGRRGHPFAPFSLRLAAGVLLLAVDVWVVLECWEFQKTLNEVLPRGIGGKLDLPFVTGIAEHWGVWALQVATAGVFAAVVYICIFARRVLPVILATVGAASLCAWVGGCMHSATDEAWKWDNGHHQRSGSHWQRLLRNL